MVITFVGIKFRDCFTKLAQLNSFLIQRTLSISNEQGTKKFVQDREIKLAEVTAQGTKLFLL